MAASAFRTEIGFDEMETRVEQANVGASLTYQITPSFGAQVFLGGIVGGEVRRPGVTHDVGPGFTGSLAVTWLALYEGETRPFVMLTASFAGSTTTTTGPGADDARLTALDARVNALVGKTFFERLTPFVTARGFAGPVTWELAGESVKGGDEHHYGAGAGVTFRAGRVDVFAEALPLGERSASLGVGAAF